MNLRQRSSLEHYCRGCSPRNWENVTLLMLTACFDAAGKLEDDKTPVICVAGFSSIASVWAEFERQWLGVLGEDEFKLPYFHAGDFAHFKKRFAGFKGNIELQHRLISRLLDVIEGCGLRKFGAIIKKSDFPRAKEIAGFATDCTVDPYVLCARSSVDDLYAFCKRESIDGSIGTIFEKGDSEDSLRKHFDKHGFPDPEFAWCKEVIKKGKSQRQFIGLQAAGWIVWEYYVDFCRVFGLADIPPTDNGRVPLRRFESLPGNIKIPYLSNPSKDLMKQLTASFGQSLHVVAEATQTLKRAKDGVK